MEIHENIEIKDLGLYLVKEKVLIISDTHIGQDEALNKEGILIPRFGFKDLKDKLGKVLDLELNEIVINGDLKHEFGIISNSEWSQTLELLDILEKKCKKIILIKGNHDTILGPIAKRKNLELKEFYKIGDVLICHGDKIIKEDCKVIIIGHEHPTVGLREDSRVEVFKCFLKGKWKGKELIVMPSFNFVTKGSDILREETLSPYLEDLSNFEVFVVSDKVYDFGKVKELK
ncbi:phosphoesterase [archaeon]|nr:phosphoesterase [archaeon]